MSARVYGGQSMSRRLRRVLVRKPGPEFAAADPRKWRFTAETDLDSARREHDELVGVLEDFGAEVLYHNAALPALADSIYVHDPVLVADCGAILLRMGKELRRGEEEPIAARLGELGVPICRRLGGAACAEGGDLLWLDDETLAVGLSRRTNAEGLRQLRSAFEGSAVSLLPVTLPQCDNPHDCLHLMSFISLVDSDLAVVFAPLLPEQFRRCLLDRGFELIEVPAAEYETLGANVLALAPRQCLALEGSGETRRRMERAGCHVLTFRGEEICLKAGGGPTCLTRPILRD